MPVAQSSGTGGTYSQPLVSLTSGTSYTTPQPTPAIAPPPGKGRNPRRQDKPQFVAPNGSSVRPAPLTANYGPLGLFGSMLPATLPVGLPTQSVPALSQLPAPSYNSTAAFTGANNAKGVQQYNYIPPNWDKIREQITALTTPYNKTGPYNGVLAAITGANMQPVVQTGFTGTDYRQNVPVSLATLGVVPPPPTQPTGNYGYRRGGGWRGYGGYGYGSGGSGSYSPLQSVMNWRLATG